MWFSRFMAYVVVVGIALVPLTSSAQNFQVIQDDSCQRGTFTANNLTLYGICDLGASSQPITNSSAYLGVVWRFGRGTSSRPELAAGIRSVTVESGSEIRGVDLNLRVDLTGNLTRVALSGLRGQDRNVANLGFGYDYQNSEVFVSSGLQRDHIRAGVDFGLTRNEWDPYLEFNSQTIPEAQRFMTTYGCPTAPGQVGESGSFNGYVLFEVADDGIFCIANGPVSGGQ
jgi:hypothetical protein